MPEVRGYIEQLLAHGLLRQTDDEFPVLALTETGVALLKDAASAAGSDAGAAAAPDEGARTPGARASRRRRGQAWTAICSSGCARVRLEIARARGVPPYVIFHDTTLREMARLKPHSIDALRTVYGVGSARRTESWAKTLPGETRRRRGYAGHAVDCPLGVMPARPTKLGKRLGAKPFRRAAYPRRRDGAVGAVARRHNPPVPPRTQLGRLANVRHGVDFIC